MNHFSKDDIDVDDDRKLSRTSWSLKGLKKRLSNKKHEIGSLPDLSYVVNESNGRSISPFLPPECSGNEERKTTNLPSFLRASNVSSKRERHCMSLDENVLNNMIQQSFLLHSKCKHYCKSTNSLYSLQNQNLSRALHTSELCQIALEINSQAEDEFSLYKDRLNCSCAKKKYHSWPKHANITKHFKYHNYGLKDHQEDFVNNVCPPVWDIHIPECSSNSTRVSFNDDHWHLLHCNAQNNKFSVSNFSNLKEKSLSQPCLISLKSQTSLKSLSSINLQDPKCQREEKIDFVDKLHQNLATTKTGVCKAKSKYDLSSITNEFNVFDEIYRSVFQHSNVADLLDEEQNGCCSAEQHCQNLNWETGDHDDCTGILKNGMKEFPHHDFDTSSCNPEITNLKRYESLVFSDTLETNSVSSFNDDVTSDSGFGRFSDLSPLFNCLQLGTEAPLFKKRTDVSLGLEIW